MHNQKGDDMSRDELFALAKSRTYEHFVIKGNETRRCSTARLHAILQLSPMVSEPIVDDAIDALVADGDLSAQVTVDAKRDGSVSDRHGRIYANIMPLRINAGA